MVVIFIAPISKQTDYLLWGSTDDIDFFMAPCKRLLPFQKKNEDQERYANSLVSYSAHIYIHLMILIEVKSTV